MEKEPLLPTTTPITNAPLPISRRRLLSSSSSSAAAASSSPSSSLCPLPEDDEVCIPPFPASPSLKHRLIFGPSADPSEALSLSLSFSNPDDEASRPPPSPLPPEDPAAATSSWAHKSNLHRCRTAPALSAINDAADHHHHHGSLSPPRRPSIVRQAVLLLAAYLALGVSIYTLNPSSFAAAETHPVVDALYFCIVTMCTIGYGDITPATPSAKLFSITFVLVGFGFVDILLSGMVSYVLDLQESLLLGAVKSRGAASTGRKPPSYIVDVKKGRMRIRMKVGLALGVVVLCIGIGALFLRHVERLDWLDSFYLSVMSVTTVGYGDRAFKSLAGRLFASVWLLVSTLAVARAFLYLAEARIDKWHRMIAKWVLSRDMTVAEFLAADMDNNGFITKSEFVIYKLKEMGKVAEKDILQICDQFDRLDTGNCGKITLSDLIETHH